MTPDWQDLLLSIKACNAGYLMDAEAEASAFAELGCTVIARLSETKGQATIFRDAKGILHFVPCGTRFSEGAIDERLADLLKDLKTHVYHPWNGSAAGVWQGAYDDAKTVTEWAMPIIGSERFKIDAHSLGAGAGTLAIKCGMIPADQLIQAILWESPKPGNSAFWKRTADVCPDKIIFPCHGLDPFFLNWPIITPLTHAGDILWVHDGIWEFTTYDGISNAGLLIDLAEHESDHGPSSIVATIQDLIS